MYLSSVATEPTFHEEGMLNWILSFSIVLLPRAIYNEPLDVTNAYLPISSFHVILFAAISLNEGLESNVGLHPSVNASVSM